MTTEDDFQAALDTHPDDWQTRLVFADWLQERGDPRADGYRALGLLRRCPHHYTGDSPPSWGFDRAGVFPQDDEEITLPPDWFEAIDRIEGSYWSAQIRT